MPFTLVIQSVYLWLEHKSRQMGTPEYAARIIILAAFMYLIPYQWNSLRSFASKDFAYDDFRYHVFGVILGIASGIAMAFGVLLPGQVIPAKTQEICWFLGSNATIVGEAVTAIIYLYSMGIPLPQQPQKLSEQFEELLYIEDEEDEEDE